jgi:hypothetical protein
MEGEVNDNITLINDLHKIVSHCHTTIAESGKFADIFADLWITGLFKTTSQLEIGMLVNHTGYAPSHSAGSTGHNDFRHN